MSIRPSKYHCYSIRASYTQLEDYPAWNARTHHSKEEEKEREDGVNSRAAPLCVMKDAPRVALGKFAFAVCVCEFIGYIYILLPSVAIEFRYIACTAHACVLRNINDAVTLAKKKSAIGKYLKFLFSHLYCVFAPIRSYSTRGKKKYRTMLTNR